MKEYQYTRERHVSEGGDWIMQGGCVGADSWSLFCDYPCDGEFINGRSHQSYRQKISTMHILQSQHSHTSQGVTFALKFTL